MFSQTIFALLYVCVQIYPYASVYPSYMSLIYNMWDLIIVRSLLISSWNHISPRKMKTEISLFSFLISKLAASREEFCQFGCKICDGWKRAYMERSRRADLQHWQTEILKAITGIFKALSNISWEIKGGKESTFSIVDNWRRKSKWCKIGEKGKKKVSFIAINYRKGIWALRMAVNNLDTDFHNYPSGESFIREEIKVPGWICREALG